MRLLWGLRLALPMALDVPSGLLSTVVLLAARTSLLSSLLEAAALPTEDCLPCLLLPLRLLTPACMASGWRLEP